MEIILDIILHKAKSISTIHKTIQQTQQNCRADFIDWGNAYLNKLLE
jgi:hypothetical protein